MKKLVPIIFLWLISVITLYAQGNKANKNEISEIRAKVIYEFTGEIEGEDDSVYVAYIEVDDKYIDKVSSFVMVGGDVKAKSVFNFSDQKWDKKTQKQVKENTKKVDSKLTIPLGRVTDDMDLKKMYFTDPEENRVKIKFVW